MSEIQLINNVVLWERRLEIEEEKRQSRQPFSDFSTEPQSGPAFLVKLPKRKKEPKPEQFIFSQECCKESQTSFPF